MTERLAALACCSAVSLLLASCGQPIEIRPVVIDATSWAKAANAPDAVGDFTALAPPNGDPARALRVVPGTVLHLSTPSLGPALGADPYLLKIGATPHDAEAPLYIGLQQPQLAEPLRLPIRAVASSYQLSIQERYFLATILSVHRAPMFGATSAAKSDAAAGLHALLLASEDKLWNALVGALRVRLIRINVKDRPQSEIAITIDRQALCQKLDLSPNAIDALRAAFPTLVPCQNGVKTPPENVELFARRRVERTNTFGALVAYDDSDGEAAGFYALPNESSPRLNGVSIVEVELKAVSPRGSGSEGRWTLEEWESSQVCAGLRISAVEFRDGGKYHIVDHANPNHHVVLDYAPENPSLRITSKEDNKAVVWLESSLARKDLALLRARDTSRIHWVDEKGQVSRCPRGE